MYIYKEYYIYLIILDSNQLFLGSKWSRIQKKKKEIEI